MWLFLSNGILSVVNHRDLEDTVLVRARVREHISYYFGNEGIYVDRDADYPYRYNLQKEGFKEFLEEYVDEMEYDNFKNSVRSNDIKRTCMIVWNVIWDIFDERVMESVFRR
ncbi:MAG: hypothetical protein CMF74_17705 [Maricaulis sp.]|jgi:hypothetical protein|nr:hypothetical protein [Maricaulis sp.]|tara:strand:- start:2287 stop:2622 length:336 start_codon:yes stop_codon:yes gene_type:complete